MRNTILLGASALVLALGVASASAQPTTEQLLNAGLQGPTATQTYEGRAAAIDSQAPGNLMIDQSRHAGR